MSSALLDTVRSLVTDGGMSRSGLARAAGLHANSLRKLGKGFRALVERAEAFVEDSPWCRVAARAVTSR